MKVIYIAGPYRGANAWEIEQNIRRAETLALAVWRAGAAAICPHTNTRHFQNAAPDEVWLAGDIEIMRRCDGVLFTPDWRDSSGAVEESEAAKLDLIPVFWVDAIDRVKVWVELDADNAQRRIKELLELLG